MEGVERWVSNGDGEVKIDGMESCVWNRYMFVL